MWVKVPIIGTGTRHDSYRPDLPAGITDWACHIPVGNDGKPLHADCVVYMPDSARVPVNATQLTAVDARTMMQQRDATINPDWIDGTNRRRN